ncbi:TcfC E-set like domain-containing protein [Photobacterium damselae subsp. damselae]|uniref:TcfC E-set like domain-containing protein n=1 Tax=Photobacterium damselae subsp. damselae TaxID=85581 RepID=A0A850QX26_PHODD|nr:TcfC E-set like domain-containing protein [Photobacterium damselae subsp. damselae]
MKTFRRKLSIILCIIVGVTFNTCKAERIDDSYPDEFSDFFKEKNRTINIEYPDGTVKQLDMIVSYDYVKLNEENRNTQKMLFDQLISQNVKKDIAKKIVNKIASKKGLKNTDKCEGFSTKCVVITDSYDIYYDIDRNLLRFFFSGEILNIKTKKKKYVNNENKFPALINSSSFFINSFNNDYSISLNDELIQGLKYGYISSKFNVDSDNSFDLDSLYYGLDFNNYRLNVGYFSTDNSMNSTDFIDSFTVSDVEEISIGSSNNLLLKSTDSTKNIIIYSPSSGLLSIKKDGQYLRQYRVSTGNQVINYSDLPKGIYTINVSIKSGNKVVYDQNYNIYNTKSGQLAKNEYDYRFQLGILKNSDSDRYRNKDHVTDIDELKYWDMYNNKSYIEGKFAYGLTNSLMLGTAAAVSNSENIYQFGISYLFLDSSSLRTTGKVYSGGSFKYDLDLYSPIFNINLSKFELDENDDFAAYTEDYASNTSINISKMFSLGINTTLGLYYNYSDYDDSENNDFTTSITYTADSNNRFDFQARYSQYDSEYTGDQNSYNFELIYTHDFDNGSSITSSYDIDNDHYSESTIEVRTPDLIKNDAISFDVTGREKIKNNDGNYESLTSVDLNGSYYNNYLNSSYYASADSDGSVNQSLSLTSNQVLSKSGLFFTTVKSDSYYQLNINRSEDIKNGSTLGVIDISKNKKNGYELSLDETKNLIRLDSYNEYETNIDTLSASIENSGRHKDNTFTYPGMVKLLKLDLSKIVSFIGAYNDLFEQGISNLTCEGDGCIDVEQVNDNIFKVAVRSGKGFVLKDKKNDYVCLTPQVRNINVLNIGKNYCIPNMDSDDNDNYQLAIRNPKNNKVMNLVYLGIFNIDNKWKYESLSKDQRLNILERKFGNDSNLVYVESKDKDVLEQLNESISSVRLTADLPIDDLSNYVLLLGDSWK